jgi:thiol-disulfide isomerase/thioredoxin
MRALLLICLLCIGIPGQTVDPLPQLSLRTLKGQTLSSKTLKDNIVVLDFWATWCEPCIGEIPAFNSLQHKYASRGVKVIGLAVQSGWPRDIKKFATKYKMRYTILVGNDDTVSDFGVISFPTTYVIGPGWKVYKKYSGSYEGKSAKIDHDIEALLQAK